MEGLHSSAILLSFSLSRFASQAKTIQTHATVNEVLDDQAKMTRLKKELAIREQEKEELLRTVQELINANQVGVEVEIQGFLY